MKSRKDLIREVIRKDVADDAMLVWINVNSKAPGKRLTDDEVREFKKSGGYELALRFEGDNVPVLINKKDFKINYFYYGRDEKQ